MSDVFIGYDGGQYFMRYLYSYGGNLYNLMTDLNNFSAATPIRMYKSTNGGTTWASLSSTLAGEAVFAVSGPPVLIGTKLYLYYASNALSSSALAYFDFTTDTFNAVTTTGSTNQLANPFMAGSAASQFYIADQEHGGNGIQISQYASNVFSAVGQVNPAGSNTFCVTEALFLGASGITHILYVTGTSIFGPGNLAYGNIVSGVVSSGTAVYAGFLDNYSDFGNTHTGGALQIGSNIYFSFYDATNKQVKLVAFTDTSSPTFTISVIDPSFPITTSTSLNPTGFWTNVLALYGSTLYCFYVNTNSSGIGDGNVYYRTSTNSGTTWSVRQTLTTHLDPIQGTPFAVWLPEAVQYVGTPGTVAKVSYLQELGDSSGQYVKGRFFFGVVAESARNYVLS